MGKPNYYLVVDLEGTCCNSDGSIPAGERETIEIGAVMVNVKLMERVDEFSILVRPVRHPILTEFCVGLTGISQADVDLSLKFPLALGKFVGWLVEHWPSDVLFCSWGKYDEQQFHRDCDYHDVRYPFRGHLDLARLFTSKTGRRRGNRGAAKFLGLPIEGRLHRGLDDARRIASMLPFLLGKTAQ